SFARSATERRDLGLNYPYHVIAAIRDSLPANVPFYAKCDNRTKIPTAAPPNTNQAEFTLYRNNKTTAITPITIAGTFSNVARANCHPTNAITATAAAFTPSRNAPAIGDFRKRGKNLAVTATNTNAGKNIPTDATAAPFHPAIT